jgi:hypothetical protein
MLAVLLDPELKRRYSKIERLIKQRKNNEKRHGL